MKTPITRLKPGFYWYHLTRLPINPTVVYIGGLSKNQLFVKDLTISFIGYEERHGFIKVQQDFPTAQLSPVKEPENV